MLEQYLDIRQNYLFELELHLVLKNNHPKYFDDNLSNIQIDSNIFEISDNRGICDGTSTSFAFTNKLIKIEAENYSSCTYGKEYIDSTWEQEETFGNYSGQSHMTALPDSKSKTGDSVDGPELIYNITNLNPGNHHLWIRMAAPDGGGDSIHVGLDGIPITYGGVGLSTHPIGEWNWEYIPINVTSNDYTQLSIWMREDGVRIDSLVITDDASFVP